MEVVLEIENKFSTIFYLIINSLFSYSTPGAAPYKTKPLQKCRGFVVSVV
jgi:hypothetical protein